jgi:hypothetical protein
MADSLKASKAGLATIDVARRRRGWTKTTTFEWRASANVSLATLKRFWRGAAIDRSAFVAICQTVGIDWREVAEAEIKQDTGFHLPENLPSIKNWVEGSRSIELERLRNYVLDDSSRTITITTVCVVGLAGIGKTTLANQLIRYLHSEQTHFKTASWQSLRSRTGKPPRFDSIVDALLFELSNGKLV